MEVLKVQPVGEGLIMGVKLLGMGKEG